MFQFFSTWPIQKQLGFTAVQHLDRSVAFKRWRILPWSLLTNITGHLPWHLSISTAYLPDSWIPPQLILIHCTQFFTRQWNLSHTYMSVHVHLDLQIHLQLPWGSIQFSFSFLYLFRIRNFVSFNASEELLTISFWISEMLTSVEYHWLQLPTLQPAKKTCCNTLTTINVKLLGSHLLPPCTTKFSCLYAAALHIYMKYLFHICR